MVEANSGRGLLQQSEAELQRFFTRYPCSTGAQARLRSCTPEVRRRVLGKFRPHSDLADYTQSLLSFIPKSDQPVRASLEQIEESDRPVRASLEQIEELALFRKRYPMDDNAFHYLLSLPEGTLGTLLKEFAPRGTGNNDFSSMLISYATDLCPPNHRTVSSNGHGNRHELPAAEAVADSDCPGTLTSSLWALHDGEKLQTGHLQTELWACMSGGEWERATLLLAQILAGSASPRVRDFDAAIGACARSGQWEHALALLEAMPKLLLVPSARSFQRVSEACRRDGQLEKVMGLWDDMFQSSVPRHLLDGVNSTPSNFEKTMPWTHALCLLDHRLHSASTVPSAEHFRAALGACESQGRWDWCLRLWDEMRNASVPPAPSHFSSTLLACAKGNRWAFGLAVLSKFLNTMKDEVEPMHFGNVLFACEKSQAWKHALELLNYMLTIGPAPSRSCFSTAISACAKGRMDTTHWAHSLHLLVNMMQPEIGATERVGAVPSVHTFGTVMSGCAKGMEWEQCVALLALMQQIGLQLNTSCALAAVKAFGACQPNAEWEQALALLKEYVDANPGPTDCDLGSALLVQCETISACEKARKLHQLQTNLFTCAQEKADEALDRSIKAALLGGQRRQDAGSLNVISCSQSLLTKLRSLDLQIARSLVRWRRHIQRYLERWLRNLQPLAQPWDTIPQASLDNDRLIRSLRDLAQHFTGDVLDQFGLTYLRLAVNSPELAFLRRCLWWDLDRVPLHPEGYWVVAAFSYSVDLGRGLGRLRSPGKLALYNLRDRCSGALGPVHMVDDRMQHRGWHAERQALLGLAFRMLLKIRAVGRDATSPHGPVRLHVNHTPCLSCVAVIVQFQGRFPSLSFGVTYDAWDRAPLLDPWDPRGPRRLAPAPALRPTGSR